MANRNFPSQRIFSMHMLPVDIDAEITISGTAGAVGSTAGIGVASCTRDSQGVYTVALQDPYYELVHVSATVQAATPGTPANILGVQVSDSDANASGGGTVEIMTLDAAGSKADPDDGTVITLLMRLNNSSVQ